MHFSFPSPDRLMRVFRSIVGSLLVNMFCSDTQIPKGNMIRSELVCCNPGWSPAMFLQQLAHLLLCRLGIALGLNQKVKNLAFIINGPPEPIAFTTDHDCHLIEMPVVARAILIIALYLKVWSISFRKCSRCRSRRSQVSGDRRTNLAEPSPDRFIGNI